MTRPLTAFSALSFLAALSGAVACSSAEPDDGTAAGGGVTDASGGAASTSGGAPSGSGGASSGSGGTNPGSGGGLGAAFVCPTGLEGTTPDLASKTATLVATAPDMDDEEKQVFLEGPVWVDGALYVSQLRRWGAQPPARILKLIGEELVEHIADSGTNGLAIRGDGLVVAASHKYFGIVSFDLSAPATPPIVIVDEFDPPSDLPLAPFNSPNDLTLRSDGNIYFTDPWYQCDNACTQGKGGGLERVYRVSPQGSVTIVPSTHESPNGIALSPDENTLYVAGSGVIESFPVAADGTVGTRSVFAPVTGVDGMTVDCAGNVYVTLHGAGKVEVYTPSGTRHDEITVGAPGTTVTNVAFGGPERKTLYVTTYNTNALHAVELDIPGYPY